jgi:hypothetical protein
MQSNRPCGASTAHSLRFPFIFSAVRFPFIFLSCALYAHQFVFLPEFLRCLVPLGFLAEMLFVSCSFIFGMPLLFAMRCASLGKELRRTSAKSCSIERRNVQRKML